MSSAELYSIRWRFFDVGPHLCLLVMMYSSILQRHSTAPEQAITRREDGSSVCIKDIFQAAIEGDVECIEANLKLGVDINSRGAPAKPWGPRFDKASLYYATPLHYACAYGRESAVYFLLNRGARTMIRSASGMTCKEYARRRNYISILVMLDEASKR